MNELEGQKDGSPSLRDLANYRNSDEWAINTTIDRIYYECKLLAGNGRYAFHEQVRSSTISPISTKENFNELLEKTIDILKNQYNIDTEKIYYPDTIVPQLQGLKFTW